MRSKIKNVFSFFLFTFILLNFIKVDARIIYKDITSISIKTNFDFDYDNLVWEGLPEITYSNEGDTESNVYISATSKYEITDVNWALTDGDVFSIGGEPKIEIFLEAVEYPYDYNNDNDYYYRFLSGYSSSNVYVSNGSFVSAKRNSEDSLKLTIKLKPIKGTYNAPPNAVWENDRGMARWEPDNVLDSGYYDLILYRDGQTVTHIEKYKGNTYNFYSFMTKDGSYTYKVRTVPGTDKQSSYGKMSEYTESLALEVTEQNRSSGTSVNNGTVGFVQQNNVWYFYNPDGKMVRGNWAKWNGKWYYFDDYGAMQTGFITVGDEQFYLSNNGDMMSGWLRSGDAYYYFNTTEGSGHFGAMCKNTWVLYDNKYFYFDEYGVMVTGWRTISDAYNNIGYYYFYPSGTTNGLFGYMAVNTVIDGFVIGADGRWVG